MKKLYRIVQLVFSKYIVKRDMKKILALFLFSVFAAQSAFAMQTKLIENVEISPIKPHNLLIQSRVLSLREVAQIISSQVPGSLSDADLSNNGGRQVYIVRWEPSDPAKRGRIIIFVVDAQTGQILERKGG